MKPLHLVIPWLLVLSQSVYGFERSATLTLVSDYLFNGISQTDENPALQGSVDVVLENGVYLGSWVSNVDFGDDTDIELDFYGGYYWELENGIYYDVGLLYYSYHGADSSDDLNYAEISAAIGKDNLEAKFWYTPDYAGTDAGHFITAVSYTYPYSPQTNISVALNHSQSLDGDKFEWQAGDRNYLHWRVAVESQMSAWQVAVAVEASDLDIDDDMKLLVSISRRFSF